MLDLHKLPRERVAPQPNRRLTMSADGHDQWHQTPAEEGSAQEPHAAQVSAKGMGITIIAMTLGVLLVFIILVVYFQNYMSNYRAMINETTTAAAESTQARDQELAALEEPVNAAMAQVIAEYASN